MPTRSSPRRINPRLLNWPRSWRSSWTAWKNVSGDDTIIRSCYDEEVLKILLEASPGSPQLPFLKIALLRCDIRLQEAIAHRERGTVAGNPRVDENGFF